MALRAFLLTLLALSLGCGARCFGFDWDYLGMDGTTTTCIEVDPVHDRLFVGTDEGFHYFDLASGLWTERDDEGQVGRRVTAIQWHPELPQRVITARENAEYYGYLELSDDLGATGEVVHTSPGGAFLDIVFDGQYMFACGVAYLVPGELVRSGDGGATWQQLAGHHQFSMTRLAVGPEGELYLGGGGIDLSWDHGETWEAIGNGLPVDDAIWGLTAEHPGGDLFVHQVLAGTNDTIYRAEWPDDWYFEPVESVSCRHLTKIVIPAPWPVMQVVQYVAVTWDGRILVSRDFGESWDDETGDLAGTPVAAGYAAWDHGLYVCTQTSGVFRAQHVVTAMEETPRPQTAVLRVWPNPFNPRTTVSFTLPTTGQVQVAIYDAKGQMVARLVNESLPAGAHTVDWDGRDAYGASMPSGTYFCRLTTNWGVETRKLQLVR